MPISGKFDKWDATLTFTSTDVTSGFLDLKIEAASVNTGSGMKDGKLKSKDFFDAKNEPYITFHSTKVVQTSHNTFDILGTFTIRGVSKPETVTFTAPDIGKGAGAINGTIHTHRHYLTGESHCLHFEEGQRSHRATQERPAVHLRQLQAGRSSRHRW